MSLTKYQTGNDLSSSKTLYPNSIKYPSFYTALSTVVNNYYDFKYVFKVYDSTGLILTKYATPNSNLLGIFDASQVVKSLIEDYDLQEVTSITNVGHSVEYKVSVQEYYDGALQGSEQDYNKGLAGNLYYNETDALLPYVISNEHYQDFYTNQLHTKFYNQSVGSRGSWLLPNSSTINSVDYKYDRLEYRVKIWNGTAWKSILYYITVSDLYTFDKTTSTVNSSNKAVIKIPIGFASLKETTVNRLGYDDSAGWHTSTATGINILDGETYDRIENLTVRLSYLNSGVSETYKWKIDECNNKDITVSWENVLGGTEIFPFNKVRNDKIVNDIKAYTHNSIVTASNRLYNDINKSNVSIFNSDKNYVIKLKTAYLTKNDVALLKGLFYSNKIGIYIDNNYYPVIAVNNVNEVPSKERPQLTSFNLELTYGKVIN